MRKSIVFVGLAVFLLTFASSVFASERPKGIEGRGELTKITFIHHKKSFAKPPWAGGGSGKNDTKCYSVLAKGAKWKNVEDYYVNTDNSDGLGSVFVDSTANVSVSEWNSNSPVQIFGDGYVDNTVSYDDTSVDGMNTMSFGSYPDGNVIAVTNVWGYFGGPPQTRELVEWDMLLNTGSDWTWGDATVDNSLMDLENIVVHELGHAAGLGHPESTCTEESMYAYSTEGEVKKRDLNAGDVAGLEELYK